MPSHQLQQRYLQVRDDLRVTTQRAERLRRDLGLAKMAVRACVPAAFFLFLLQVALTQTHGKSVSIQRQSHCLLLSLLCGCCCCCCRFFVPPPRACQAVAERQRAQKQAGAFFRWKLVREQVKSVAMMDGCVGVLYCDVIQVHTSLPTTTTATTPQQSGPAWLPDSAYLPISPCCVHHTVRCSLVSDRRFTTPHRATPHHTTTHHTTVSTPPQTVHHHHQAHTC